MGQVDIFYGSMGVGQMATPSQRYTSYTAAVALETSQRARLVLVLFCVGKQTEFYGSHSRLSTV
jgi:hypothetical protein